MQELRKRKKLKAETRYVAAGSTVRGPVTLVKNLGVISMKISWGYDETALELVDVLNGHIFNGDSIIANIESDNPFALLQNLRGRWCIMKKSIMAVLIALMIILNAAGCIEAFGLENPDPSIYDCTLSASLASNSEPGQVDVLISLEQTESSPGLNALAFGVTYDQAAFELIGKEKAQSESENMEEYSFSENYEVYPYRCGWLYKFSAPYKGSVELIQLTFRVKEGAIPGSSYQFNIVNTEGGYTSIVDGIPVSTKVTFNTVGCEYSTPDYGDVDKNGKVDFADALYLKRYIAGWTNYQEIDKSVADLNSDGNVNLADLEIIERHIAGWKDYCSLPMNVK